MFSDKGNYRPRPTDILVNYGFHGSPVFAGELRNSRIINSFDSVRLASNKLSTFDKLTEANIPIPEYTKDRSVADEWLREGFTVLCRVSLSGSGGEGIVPATISSELVPAPLYVKYIKKKKEFRVHVAFGKVIDVQEKRKDSEYEGERLPFIRNHSNGYVFCRNNITEPDRLRDVSISAVTALGLDFGAVDLIWNEKYNQVYVLEINTAPGLEGTTVETYANAFVENLIDKNSHRR